jgi:hypothetical protein
LHKLRLDEIETEHVVAVLRKVWHQREISRDTRQRLKKIFETWLHTRQPQGDGLLRSARVHAEARRQSRTKRAGAEVTILTLTRTIEVQNMRWSKLDLESGLWDLGIVDTKNERPKRTPLPRQTLLYLREAHESRVSDEFVFPGRGLDKPISNMTMLKHLKEITGDETLTVHGFR